MSRFEEVLTEGLYIYGRALKSPENKHLFIGLLNEAVERANFALEREAQTPSNFRDAFWLLIEAFMELGSLEAAEHYLDVMEEKIEKRDEIVSYLLQFKLAIAKYRAFSNLPRDFWLKEERPSGMKHFLCGWFYARFVDTAAKNFLEKAKELIQFGAVQEPFIYDVIAPWVMETGIPVLQYLDKPKTGKDMLQIAGLMPHISTVMKQ